MSIRWERFAGDTSSFAVRLAFHHDPDAGAAASPEMTASWGAIQIWVRGINLCAHVDQGETLQSSHWYLLPLLEWLSSNWDPLLHEERPPVGMQSISVATEVGGTAAAMALARGDEAQTLRTYEERYEWEQRHSLRAARDGGVLPDIRFRRLRDQVEISWSSSQVAGADGVEFLSPEGVAYRTPTSVAAPLHEVLESAAAWLLEQLPMSDRCKDLVESVEALRTPERNEERSAWLAGLGATLDRVVEGWRDLRELGKSLGRSDAFDAVFGTDLSSQVVLSGSCEAALLFGSTSPNITHDDATVLAKLLLDAYEPSPMDGLADMVFDEPIDPSRRPWQHGYELAEELLDTVIGDLDGPGVDVEALLADWKIRLTETELTDRQLRAVAFVSSKHAPSVVLNSSHRSASSTRARRFTLAHELCHLLHDRSHGTRLAIASGPWAPRAIEQRANAFAAWLLMPPNLLRAAIETSAPLDTLEGVRSVADRLDVGSVALIEHLHNLDYIDEEQRDKLRSPTVD